MVSTSTNDQRFFQPTAMNKFSFRPLDGVEWPKNNMAPGSGSSAAGQVFVWQRHTAMCFLACESKPAGDSVKCGKKFH